jgi:hypothetical protein
MGEVPGPVSLRLRTLGITLPEPLPSVGHYASTRLDGTRLWVAGHTARTTDGPALAGIVGVDLSVEEAAEQARLAALNLLSAADRAVGVDRVRGVIHLRGFVRSGSDFDRHPAVIDGASLLLAAVFPDAPPHARAALGAVSLPGGAGVELEAVFAVDAGAT